jgi:uncharacterized membrane protein YccC
MLSTVPAWVKVHRAEVRLAIRVTVSALLAFALASVLGLPQGFWAVLTAIIVMQASLGASIKAAVDRFLGTLSGAVAGALIALLVPHGSSFGLGIALACAVAPLALLAALKASFRIAPITALIVLLPTTSHQIGPLEAALLRVLEVTLGNLVGLVVSLFVLPARAHGLVAEKAAQILEVYSRLVPTSLAALDPSKDRASVQDLHKALRTLLKQLETVAEEAARERQSHLTDDPDAEPLVRTLYRIRHDLVMLGRSASRPLPDILYERLGPSLTDISDVAGSTLKELGGWLTSRKRQFTLDPLEAALDGFGSQIAAIRRDHLTRDLSSDVVERLYALGFSLEQLRQDLRDLADRAGEWSRGKSALIKNEGT